MNRLSKWLTGMSIVIALSATACANAPAQTLAPASTDAPAPVVSQVYAGAPASALTAAEADALAFMREEEKLARDVYTALYAKWNLPVFQNIAQSEQTHMDSLKGLLDRYGVADPAAGTAAGVFVNPELQQLYNQLAQQGAQSLVEALRVGALIEEVDIADLQTRVAQTNHADIKLVYDNLMRGSRNHLRSFVAQLERSGVAYTPQKLASSEYASIINATTETGRGNGNANQGNGFRGGRR